MTAATSFRVQIHADPRRERLIADRQTSLFRAGKELMRHQESPNQYNARHLSGHRSLCERFGIPQQHIHAKPLQNLNLRVGTPVAHILRPMSGAFEGMIMPTNNQAGDKQNSKGDDGKPKSSSPKSTPHSSSSKSDSGSRSKSESASKSSDTNVSRSNQSR